MRKIKLSYYEWSKIQGYKKVHWLEILCCYFRMVREDNVYYVYAKVHPVAYILLFIPVILLTFFDCIWNCGLKKFQLPSMWLTGSYIFPEHIMYDYCEVTWDAKNKG